MDLLNGNLKKIYLKYLISAIGSAVVVSIYSTVDMVVTGQYEGPDGISALSVITPLWSIVVGLGVLVGLGGAILFSMEKGKGSEENANKYFSVASILALIITLFFTSLFFVFRSEIMTIFGANEKILPLTMDYTFYVAFAVPFFILHSFFMPFVRNDNNPVLATISVMSGGIFNIVADVVFVFGFDMGIAGAGLGTALGQLLSFCVICTHFFKKNNSIKFVKINNVFKYMAKILATGAAPFLDIISFGIFTILFNNQIVRYSSDAQLAVFGVIINITFMLQSVFQGAGQAGQPAISVAFGAKKNDRIKTLLKMLIKTEIILGIGACVLFMAFPNEILKVYMNVTDEVLLVGKPIIYSYVLCYIPMGVNIGICFYFQAIMKSKETIFLSLTRSLVLCSAFVLIIPVIFKFDFIWFSQLLSEVITFFITCFVIKNVNKKIY